MQIDRGVRGLAFRLSELGEKNGFFKGLLAKRVLFLQRGSGVVIATVVTPLALQDRRIDVAATELFVAVSADKDSESERSFGAFTSDLHALADWLGKGGIRTVAMESTGVYWIQTFQVLEVRGVEVCLVNARYLRNVP
jgi:hypothetical protein